MLHLAARTCIQRSLVARSLSTTPTPPLPPKPKSSNLPFIFGGLGVAGLGFYSYLRYSSASSGSVAAHVEAPKPTSPLDPNEFKNFKLKRVEPYNHNSSTFVFELPNNQASHIPVASCLVIKSSDPDALKTADGKPVIRPYTPISPPDQPGELSLLVKKYPKGVGSVHIHSLKPGDSLAFKGPITKFEYKTNEFSEIGLVGGGSGITPLYQVLTHALADKNNKTKFTLLYSNVSEADILLRNELEALQKKHPENLSLVFVLDKADRKWKGPTGFINKDILQKHLPAASQQDKVKVFVCGPPGQVDSVAGKKEGMKQGALGGYLKDLGYTEGQVFKF